MQKKPKITIVTASYNQALYLDESICSILDQNYSNLEYIIIDGGSTDNSVDIIRKHEKHITYWVSEPDKGQSDAFNKGFKLATGDFCTWVNSDDILLPGALKKVSRVIETYPEIDWIAGNTLFIDTENCITHCSHLPRQSTLLATWGMLSVGGPSTFFSRSIYNRSRGFCRDLFYTMDIDLWWQFYSLGIGYYRIPEYLMAFRIHSMSKCASTSFNQKENKKEIFLQNQKKKKERDLLIRQYAKINLLPLAKILYRFKQLLNGNYIKSWIDLRKMYGCPLKKFFSEQQQ